MAHLNLLSIAVLSRVASGLSGTLMVLYLTQHAGLAAVAVGVVLTVTTAVAVAASTWLGHLADRLGAREMYAATALAQAIGAAGLVAVQSVPVFTGIALLLALSDLAQRSALGAVIHAAVAPAERLGLRARSRVAANIGFAVGAGLGGVALGLGGFDLGLSPRSASAAGLLVAAAFLLASLVLILRIRRVPPIRSGHRSWEALRDLRYVRYLLLNGLLNLHNPMLNVGVPLWIATQTSAPHWTVSLMLIVNTATVILCQIRLTRSTDSLAGAAVAGRRSGILLAAACVVLAGTSVGTPAVTICLLVLAALIHAVGEILEAASGWGVSYNLAPPGLVGQYQGAHAMGRGLGDLTGPALLTVVTLPLGPAGWLVIAAVFLAAAALIPSTLREPTLADR